MKKMNLWRCVVVAVGLMTNISVWAHDGDHTYANGICTIEGCTDPYEAPTQDGDYFLVANAGNVEWIGDYVQNVSITPKVKMTADIDFTGVTHNRIGRNEGKKFNGEWDGQGHRIENLVMNLNEDIVGFFGWVRGGSTIKNLILGSTCSFTGNTRVAAFIGVTQVHSGGTILIQNCVNEAAVTANNANAAAFVGSRNPVNQNSPRILISHCVNRGNITGSKESAAFVGFMRFENDDARNAGRHRIEYSYNTGTVTGIDGTKNLYRDSGSDTEVVGSYDLGSHTAKGQGSTYEWATADPVTSGELAFIINTDASENVFFQTIGTDAYPVPFNTSGTVYAHGTYRCDGVLLPGTTYNNTGGDAPVIPPHDYSANGICQNNGCTKPYQAPATDSDGWTLIANAGNVEWLSETVSANNGSYVAKAKLVADIDFENKVNLHSPIGPSKGAKFKGEFDGQGHHIMNMIINQPDKEAQGFFGWLQGNSNTYIHDLIIDSSCSITAANKAGGLAGASQNYNEAATIHIENVVTGANVTVTGQDAAGIVGGEEGNKANYLVRNCVNTGTITSTHQDPYVGALFCYQERGTVENFINLGTINGHLGGNIGRFNGCQLINIVDLSDTQDKTQAVVEDLTTDDIASGKLAFYMNEQAGEEVFFQTLGTDEHPMPFSTSLQVYGEAWDAINTVYYNNNEGVVTASGVTIDDQCRAFTLPAGATSISTWKVAYSRDNVAGFNTVCLPFALTADLLPSGAKIYTLGDIKEASIDVNEATEVAAGVPCLVEFPADYTGTWDIAIDETTALAVEPVAGTLKGSYVTETIGAGKYKLNSTGTAFGQTTEAATIKPFRAYVEAEGSAKELTLNFGGETGIESLILHPSSVISHPSSVYDLQGRKTTLRKGINIVKMANGETRKIVVK